MNSLGGCCQLNKIVSDKLVTLTAEANNSVKFIIHPTKVHPQDKLFHLQINIDVFF